MPIYELLFDYRLAADEQRTRGAAFVAADTAEHAERVLRAESQFRRAAELEVRTLLEKPSGFVLAWNVYPGRKTGRSDE